MGSSGVDGRIPAVSDSGEKGKKLPSLERGPDLSRILAFTDGVFAIAITLLVLQIEVPQGLTSNSGFLDELDNMLPDFTAFAISFIVIGVFWINHHRLMRMVKEYDSLLIGLTMLYLGGIVLLPFSTQLIGEYGTDVTLSAVFYILNLALVALAQALMIRTIITHGLGDPDYRWDLESSFKSSLFMTGVFLATAPIALVIGAWTPILWLVLLRFDPFQRERDSRYKNG
jgi:uncharacterized membrane protein